MLALVRLHRCHVFQVGPALLAQAHKTSTLLWTYDQSLEVPSGVKVARAADLIPTEQAERARTTGMTTQQELAVFMHKIADVWPYPGCHLECAWQGSCHECLRLGKLYDMCSYGLQLADWVRLTAVHKRGGWLSDLDTLWSTPPAKIPLS